jgi:hypothetical protein
MAIAALLVPARPGEADRGQGPARRFDLTRPNEAFFQRLNSYTVAASGRRIVTLVALYNAWMNNSEEGWNLNPFNPRNNVNRETDALTSGDLFMRELGRAVEGDVSTPTRTFLRDVWMTLARNVARNTPDATLLQPLSESFKDAGEFHKTAFFKQTADWWGKGNVVDNVRRVGQAIVPSATYADIHESRENFDLLRPMTIANTDDTCSPPASEVIARMSREAVARRSNYLVYDCEVRGDSWNPRVIDAIRAGLVGMQPAVKVGTPEGSLVGYGFPDTWINLAVTGKAETFLDELRRAGGNFTFVLVVLNPNLGAMMPWQERHDDVTR